MFQEYLKPLVVISHFRVTEERTKISHNRIRKCRFHFPPNDSRHKEFKMITFLALALQQPVENPELIKRKPVPYVAIRSKETMQSLSTVFPRLMPKIRDWCVKHHLKDTAGFLRYYKVDMKKGLEIEIGVVVDRVAKGEGDIRTGKIPGGRYVNLTHFGDFYNLVPQNGAVQDWAKSHGKTIKMTKSGEFASRIEYYYSNPDTEPDKTKWKSEIMYMVI